MKPAMKKIKFLFFLAGLTTSFIRPANAAFESKFPPVGSKTLANCGVMKKEIFYKKVSSSNKEVTIKVTTGQKKYERTVVKLPWMFVTDIYVTQTENGKVRKSNKVISGNLDKLISLELGKVYKGVVQETGPSQKPFKWNYVIKILKKKKVKTKNFGSVDVLEIEENRVTPHQYHSKLITYYAPSLSENLYWNYSDNRKFNQTCIVETIEKPKH